MCFVMEYMSNGSLFDVIHNKSVDLKVSFTLFNDYHCCCFVFVAFAVASSVRQLLNTHKHISLHHSTLNRRNRFVIIRWNEVLRLDLRLFLISNYLLRMLGCGTVVGCGARPTARCGAWNELSPQLFSSCCSSVCHTWLRLYNAFYDSSALSYFLTFWFFDLHRDLKSHNLLIDQHWRCKVCHRVLSEKNNAWTDNGNDAYRKYSPSHNSNSLYDYHFQVADFGLSRVVEKDKLEQTLTAVGTPCWRYVQSG